MRNSAATARRSASARAPFAEGRPVGRHCGRRSPSDGAGSTARRAPRTARRSARCRSLATAPSSTSTHFEWVPGMQTSAVPDGKRRPPASCVSSPRMHVRRGGVALAKPGTMRTSRWRRALRPPATNSAERRRHGDIGRLDPALAGARHAADDDRQLSVRRSAARWPSRIAANPSLRR